MLLHKAAGHALRAHADLSTPALSFIPPTCSRAVRAASLPRGGARAAAHADLYFAPTAFLPLLPRVHREVETLFHEAGHALQHMLTEQREGLVAGIRGVEWDAVELPSQFMENWAYDR